MSSNPSTKKTRSWRARNLVPAGFVKRQDDERPLAEVSELWDTLLTSIQVAKGQRESYPFRDTLPSWMIGDGENWDDSTIAEILAISKSVSDKAKIGSASMWNEETWRLMCHTPALLSITKLYPKELIMSVEEPWKGINLKEGTILLSHKPDYSFSLRVSPRGTTPLSRPILDGLLVRLDPYLNENRELAFAFAVAESKSFQGSELEAENQCGEAAIKMLFKLRQLGGDAIRLPVVCMALIGSRTIVYVASSSMESSGENVYYMQEIWSGKLTRFADSLQFHIMFYRYLGWVSTIFNPTIISAISKQPGPL